MAEHFSSLLTGPTIQLLLPSADPSLPDHSYTIHRHLLHTSTSLLTLHPIRTRDHTLTLPPTTPHAALQCVLEYLYTHTYTPPALPPITAPSRPQTPPTENPFLDAAMASPLGIWGNRKAAVHDDVGRDNNISSYTSTYLPGYRNGYATPPVEEPVLDVQSRDVFPDYEPVAAGEKVLLRRERTVEEEVGLGLEVWELARRWGVEGLGDAVRGRLEGVLERGGEGVLRALVREVYGCKVRDEGLRGWLVGWVVREWGRVRAGREVRELVREGGEFVVDVLERV